MDRLRLVHWNEAEARERAARLRSLGYAVDHQLPDGAFFRALQKNPPAALVIDLGRLPGQGRDLAVAVRTKKGLRSIPLVFVGGAPEKVTRVKELLPDAAFTGWRSIRTGLKKALSRRHEEVGPPPGGVFAGYAGTPLSRKLGLQSDSVVILVGAPDDFEKNLGDVPDGVTFRRRARGVCDLAIWFVRSRKEVERRVTAMGALGRDLWIAWPKKTSGVDSDLTQNTVRRIGLDSGLVDYKICAIDATWSALKFTRRKPR